MKIKESNKLKILFYWDLGIPVAAIALILKISETYVKNHLKLNNRNGPPPKFPQAYKTWLYLNQQFGELVLNYPSKDDQQQEQQLKEKNSEQEVKITQLTDELQRAYDRDLNRKSKFDKINLENQDLNKRIIQLTKEIETEKRGKEGLKDTVYSLFKEYKVKIEQEHHRDIEEQKNKVKEKDQYIIKIEENLQKLKDDLITANAELGLSYKANDTITKKYKQLEQEMTRLKEKQDTVWIKYAIVGFVGVDAGIVVDHLFFKPTSNSTLPQSVEYGKNTGYDAIPKQKKDMIQPGIYRIDSGVDIPGTRLIGFGFGEGFKIVIPPLIQKYIKQT